jgi:hypothetical protein
LANFLSVSPNQTKFLPSVCLVPAGLFCHANYRRNSKKSAKNSKCTGKEKTFEKKIHQIFKLLNLCGNQLISPLAVFVFVPSVFKEKFPTAGFA